MEYRIRLLEAVVVRYGILSVVLAAGTIIYARHEQDDSYSAIFEGIYSVENLPTSSFVKIK